MINKKTKQKCTYFSAIAFSYFYFVFTISSLSLKNAVRSYNVENTVLNNKHLAKSIIINNNQNLHNNVDIYINQAHMTRLPPAEKNIG